MSNMMTVENGHKGGRTGRAKKERLQQHAGRRRGRCPGRFPHFTGPSTAISFLGVEPVHRWEGAGLADLVS